MGCYPLFSCQNWSLLAEDLRGLTGELVSLVVVADPFADVEREVLDRSFNNGAVPFKNHYVVELDRPADKVAGRHHRRNSRKALQKVYVERLERPAAFLNDWVRLYDTLIDRHHIQGISAFSRSGFAQQFEVPGLIVFRAVAGGETVGMLIWYVQGEIAYYHLGAYSRLGYQLDASFALFWVAIEHFTGKLRWLNLGGGAGLGEPSPGLDRFKAGWATATRTAYLCRHIFQPARYEQISAALGGSDSSFFPAYRANEHERSQPSDNDLRSEPELSAHR